MLDFHNHVIPDVDDGARSVAESLSALETMWAQGVRHVIATPHFNAAATKHQAEFQRSMDRIDTGWEKLTEGIRVATSRIEVYRAVELALDDPAPIVTDARLCLARTRFILVEFPSFTIPSNSVAPLRRLRESGLTPIIAHPERYKNAGDFEILEKWKEAGAFLQLNAGSLIGFYGSQIEKNAWTCLALGTIDYLSSDYHARGACFVEDARKRILEHGGEEQLRIIHEVNGDRLLANLDPLPVSPLRRSRSPWRKVVQRIWKR